MTTDDVGAGAGRLSPREPARTLWSRQIATPVRQFLRTESGSARVLVAAIVLALVWANLSPTSYQSVWRTVLSVRLGAVGIDLDLRTWVNSGLMAFFFLVVGLEARREIDLGELRERDRLLLPAAVGLIAMAVPVSIYLLLNHGGPGARGWGVAMSTDTALALGMLLLVGREVPDRVRAFLLTVFVVDDIAALLVIAVVYTERVRPIGLVVALLCYALLIGLTVFGVRRPAIYTLLGVVVWVALLASGIDPVVAGLAIGLTAAAYTPGRDALEQATGGFRLFREQPTAELAQSAARQLNVALSPNARLQRSFHLWTSYLVVPLFGLANAGIAIDASSLGRASTSPIFWGVLAGYVLGKPIGVVGGSWLVSRLSAGRLRPTVGWAAVTGSGTIAGIGFTVSFLIASLAFSGAELGEAKLGVLAAALVASLLTAAVFRITAVLSPERRAAALFGNARQLIDLVTEVDEERDHIRGPREAAVTLVEYGDFECPYCGRAESAVESVINTSDIRYVWRHLPLTDVHPQAQVAADAAEAAAAQDAFWRMHDLLLSRQDRLRRSDLESYAAELGLDVERFRCDLDRHRGAKQVDADVESADLSGVSGTPTFFINGRRHYGAYDADSLRSAIQAARDRASVPERG